MSGLRLGLALGIRVWCQGLARIRFRCKEWTVALWQSQVSGSRLAYGGRVSVTVRC